MKLLLHRNGIPVDFAPIRTGSNWYYPIGMIGSTHAYAGWEYDQELYDEDVHGEPVFSETVMWALNNAPPEPEPEPDEVPVPTIEQIRAAMPTVSRRNFPRLLLTISTVTYPLGVLPSTIRELIETIPDNATKELTLWDFENAEYFSRSDPLIDQVGASLGLSPEDIDAVWINFGTNS